MSIRIPFIFIITHLKGCCYFLNSYLDPAGSGFTYANCNDSDVTLVKLADYPSDTSNSYFVTRGEKCISPQMQLNDCSNKSDIGYWTGYKYNSISEDRNYIRSGEADTCVNMNIDDVKIGNPVKAVPCSSVVI